MFYQVPLQIILLLLAISETPTTGGLEAMFKQSSFLGINMDPKAVLALSVSWSLRTCVFLHLKSVATEKGFLQMTSKIAVFLWGLFAVMRRVLTLVAFFIPCLGLFSVLYHWQAELIPFRVRLGNAASVTAEDLIKLRGLNDTIFWSELDRWDYSHPDKPSPPPYSIYTGLSLGNTFIAFFVLTLIQFLSLGLVKIFTSEEFGSVGSYFNKFLHIIQSLNMSIPYVDWDAGIHTIEEYRARYSNTVSEMRASFLVNFVFSFIMMCPLWYTGEYFS